MALDREAIEAQLKALPREKIVAFAARTGLRALLLLVDERDENKLSDVETKPVDFFTYWSKSDKAKHVSALFHACGVAYLIVNKRTFSVAETAQIIAEAARIAANSAYTKIYAAEAATNAANAAYAMVYLAGEVATHAAANIYVAIENDLLNLHILSVADFLNQPLYANSDNWQANFSRFKVACLSLNVGFEIWLDWYEDRLLGKPIDFQLLETWFNVPAEIEAQGVASISAYLLNPTYKVPLNRVRAIFIGYGEAGKTSLIRVLNGQPVVEGKEPMTPGIAISDWPIPNTEIKANFWDFGGQVMAHSTHQFFLRERCLYVLMLNSRSEINATEQAEYWLEHVKSFGKNAPVMIVGNKTDLVRLNLNMEHLKSKYANIVGYYPLSCTEMDGAYHAEYQVFYRDFCQQLQAVGIHQMMFTPQQFSVLQEILRLNRTQSFLKHNDFDALCAKLGVAEEGVQNKVWLLDVLDKLGIVIHFQQLKSLDEYVLNPRWLTHGMYSLMYAQQPQLSPQDVEHILADKTMRDEYGNQLSYPPSKCHFIMEAMREFKLCYPLHNTKTIMIPELLQTDQPADLQFDQVNALAFDFRFQGFLPRNIMPEMIVTRYQEIKDQVVWQCGVLLQSQQYQAEALLKVDYHERLLHIWVLGSDAGEYLKILNDSLLTILNRMDLDFEEQIWLPAAAALDATQARPEKVGYRQLMKFAQNGLRYISPVGVEYDARKVLAMMPAGNVQPNAHVGGNVINQFITGSNIQGSVVAAESINKSFNSAQASPPTATQPPVVSPNSSASLIPEVFVSYAWNDPSNAMVDKLQQALGRNDIQLKRDKQSLQYKDSIREFMQRIGRGKCVVVVISEKYLKSANCMFEMLQVVNAQDLRERIFPIVLEDANIYDALARARYQRYWQQKADELDAELKTLKGGHQAKLQEELKLYIEIGQLMDEITDTLRDMNALTPDMHEESDFVALMERVKHQLLG